MLDITVLGDTNLDVLVPAVEGLPEKEQIFLDKLLLKVGGGAANFALAASDLEFKVRLISSVGNDEIGSFLLKKMEKPNLDLKISRLNAPTGVTVGIQFESGKKNLFTWKSHNALFSLKDFDLNMIEGNWLQVFGYNILDSLRPDMKKILEFAKEKEMVVGFDPDLKAGMNFSKQEFLDLTNFIDVLFLNEDEAKLIGVSNLNVRTVVIKRGSKGCFAVEKGEKVEIPAEKVEVKNPTGAGDVFDAAFVHHYFYGYDLRECLEFAQEKAVEYLSKF